MKDLRAERIHRKKVKRARKLAHRNHAGGLKSPKYYGQAIRAAGRQGRESTSGAHVSFWVGTDKVVRTSEFDRIQDKKERRRARRQKEAM